MVCQVGWPGVSEQLFQQHRIKCNSKPRICLQHCLNMLKDANHLAGHMQLVTVPNIVTASRTMCRASVAGLTVQGMDEEQPDPASSGWKMRRRELLPELNAAEVCIPDVQSLAMTLPRTLQCLSATELDKLCTDSLHIAKICCIGIAFRWCLKASSFSLNPKPFGKPTFDV